MKLKPLVSYYGGKQRMARHVIELINQIEHTVYVEPFCGGAAVFFAKERPNVPASAYREVINDLNGALITMYRVAKLRPDEFRRACEATLHSRKDYERAVDVYKHPDAHDELTVAWACWVGFNQGYANKIGHGWRTGKDSQNHVFSSCHNKKAFLPDQCKRLEQAYIECDDALSIIKRWDSPNTLFYCDPPYPNTTQGHYNGYTQDDFDALVTTLKNIQGNHILSCYLQENMPPEWEYKEITARMSASNGKNRKNHNTKRTECLWYTNKHQPRLLEAAD